MDKIKLYNVLSYSTVVMFTAVPSFLFLLLFEKYFLGDINYPMAFSIALCIAAGATIFTTVKDRAEQVIEKKIFKEKSSYHDIIKNASEKMVSILDMEELTSFILNTIHRVMKIDRLTIMLFIEGKDFYSIKAKKGYEKDDLHEIKILPDDPFIKYLEKNMVMLKSDLQAKHTSYRAKEHYKEVIVERMEQIYSEISIPLKVKKRLIGSLNIGRKKKGKVFSQQDIHILSTLSNNAATAIENARLYENLKKAKAKIHRANRLASLGTLTASLAHEIKDPLLSIDKFLKFLPGRMNNEENINVSLHHAVSEVDRICYLISDLLSFARPAELEFGHEDINRLLENILKDIKSEAEKKNVRIKKNSRVIMPMIYVNKNQIKQALMNILLNVVYNAKPDNELSIKISSISLKNKKKQKESFIKIQITDPARKFSHNKESDPAFLALSSSKYKKIRGMEFLVAQHIIKEHRGGIEVKNKYGEGGAVIVTLPKNPRVLERRKAG